MNVTNIAVSLAFGNVEFGDQEVAQLRIGNAWVFQRLGKTSPIAFKFLTISWRELLHLFIAYIGEKHIAKFIEVILTAHAGKVQHGKEKRGDRLL